MKRVKEAKEIQAQYEGCECIKSLIVGVNKVVAIYEQHKADVQAKIKDQDFADVDGLDFDEWAHDQESVLEDIFWSLKMKIGDLQFAQQGLNIIEI